MASNIAVKISLPIVLSIASARDRPARGAFVASRLVERNALAEFLGQVQASGILGHGQPQRMIEQQSVRSDLISSRLAYVCRLAGKPPQSAEALREFLKLYGKLASDGGRLSPGIPFIRPEHLVRRPRTSTGYPTNDRNRRTPSAHRSEVEGPNLPH